MELPRLLIEIKRVSVVLSCPAMDYRKEKWGKRNVPASSGEG